MDDRLGRVRAGMAEAGLDALYVAGPVDDVFGRHSANRRYLSGFTGSAGAAVVTGERAILAVDFRYVEQAERESAPLGFEVLRIVGRERRSFAEAVHHAGLAGKKIGLSRADLSYQGFLAIEEAVSEMPAAERPEVVPAPLVIEKLRARKSVAELAALQRAIDAADRAMALVQAGIEPGETERAVALAVERAVRECGGDGVSFETIVAGGAWGAMPHASPRNEPIRAGEPIIIDMGSRLDGYCSDLTRTFTLGETPPRFREVYEIVYEAQRNAIERVEAGMSGRDAHDLAASVIETRGYGEQFGHGLGHGVGLEVHEAPYLGPTSEDTLEDGMVFTIEPGIYVPGWGGVRIEDVVVLENGRARVLSHAAKLTPAGVQS